MKSYWQESVNKNKYPQLTENIKTDVCIIGGGITRNINCVHACEQRTWHNNNRKK